MSKYKYITLREKPQFKARAAEWFHSKWGVPQEAYLECMEAYLNSETESGWYLCLDDDKSIGGLGVIENECLCSIYGEGISLQGNCGTFVKYGCGGLEGHDENVCAQIIPG